MNLDGGAIDIKKERRKLVKFPKLFQKKKQRAIIMMQGLNRFLEGMIST